MYFLTFPPTIQELIEVISYITPPVAVEHVLRAFLLLLGNASSKELQSWDEIRKRIKLRTSLTARNELARLRPEDIGMLLLLLLLLLFRWWW